MNDPQTNAPATLGGGVSESQLAHWKATHGRVFRIEVDAEDDDADGQPAVVVGFFKKPDLDTISLVTKKSSDPILSLKILFDNCWLGGDAKLQTEPDLLITAATRLGEQMHNRVSRLKKL